MYPNPRFVAFYGKPKDTLVMADFTCEVKMAMDTFMDDVLTHFGLYIGRPMGFGCLYPEEAKKLLNDKSKIMFSLNPASAKMKSVSFLHKYYYKCMRTPSEDVFGFCLVTFRKYFNLYFTKATGMDAKFAKPVLSIMIKGLKIMMKEVCENKTHMWAEAHDFVSVVFKADAELEKRSIFQNNFHEIYNRIGNSKLPITFFEEDELSNLLEELSHLAVEYKGDLEIQDYLRILKKMVMESKTRGIAMGIRMIPAED